MIPGSLSMRFSKFFSLFLKLLLCFGGSVVGVDSG